MFMISEHPQRKNINFEEWAGLMNNANHQRLLLRKSTVIGAGILRAWDALINPAVTEKYVFGMDVYSDWRVGSEILWKEELSGKRAYPRVRHY